MKNSIGVKNNSTQFIYDITRRSGRPPKDLTHINPSCYNLQKVGRIICEHDKFDTNATRLDIHLLLKRGDGEDEAKDIRLEIVELLQKRGFFIGKLNVDF